MSPGMHKRGPGGEPSHGDTLPGLLVQLSGTTRNMYFVVVATGLARRMQIQGQEYFYPQSFESNA